MAAVERKESNRDSRDTRDKTQSVPLSSGGLKDNSAGRDGTHPFRGVLSVPLSPSPSGGLLIFESEDEAAFFEERAAIREYSGAGVPRVAAERLAMMDVLNARRVVAEARNQVEREAG